MFFTDRPADFDGDESIDNLLNSPTHAQDPMHVPIRIEGASGENLTSLSRMLRRIMLPLGLPESFWLCIIRKSDGPLPPNSLLPAAVASMTEARRKSILKVIDQESFPQTPYKCIRGCSAATQLVDYIAAACKSFPAELMWRNAKRVSV